MFGDLTTPKDVLFKIGEKFISALYGGSKDSVDALRYRQFTSPKYVPLERMPPTSRHATTIASGYTYKWSHGVPFNHSSAQTNLASSLRMEHLCQSSQTRLQHHQKCSGKSVVPASQPTAFAHHVPASRIGCHAACSANAEDNVRTAALFPMDATDESVRFAQQGNENEFHSK